jgi:hypothetical protein
MDAVGLIVLFLVLGLLIGGGFIGYYKLYRPYACNNKDADSSSNVATWAWSSDDSNCYANTCTAGYTTDGSSYTCVLKTGTLGAISTSNACAMPTGGTATVNAATSDPTCGTACTGGDGTCMGYSWDNSNSTAPVCSIITGAAPTAAGTKPGTCYSATWA